MMSEVYTNPVYDRYFADPFVLKHNGRYYAYGTAPGSDGAQFPILTSEDMVHWALGGWALQPRQGVEFWAPEVAFHDGRFYMYYSARGIENRDHQLRVAVSDNPLGEFVEIEHDLIPDQPFTIDAHPFRDSDGQWYLFYAQDFLTVDNEYRVGTGLVVDRLVDMTTLAGDPRVVVRPFADWQLFSAGRTMYNAVYDWHTVEGAFVLPHAGKYFCFYSGGAWEHENYAVAYVVADHPLGPYERPPADVSAVLRSVPGHVFGPGHNSFVSSPDDSEMFIVYHAWDSARTMRRMCIDRFGWDGDEPRSVQPTWTPQPVPSKKKD